MAAPKFHISRDELELGPFPQSELSELLEAGFLLPTDLFWSEGQATRRPLAEFHPWRKPIRVSVTAQVAKTMIAAAESVRARAVLASTRMSAAEGRNKAVMSNAVNRMLEDFLPRLRTLVTRAHRKTMKSAEQALQDEVLLQTLFGAVYDILPKPVRRFVDEKSFIMFCLQHRRKLFKQDT